MTIQTPKVLCVIASILVVSGCGAGASSRAATSAHAASVSTSDANAEAGARPTASNRVPLAPDGASATASADANEPEPEKAVAPPPVAPPRSGLRGKRGGRAAPKTTVAAKVEPVVDPAAVAELESVVRLAKQETENSLR